MVTSTFSTHVLPHPGRTGEFADPDCASRTCLGATPSSASPRRSKEAAPVASHVHATRMLPISRASADSARDPGAPRSFPMERCACHGASVGGSEREPAHQTQPDSARPPWSRPRSVDDAGQRRQSDRSLIADAAFARMESPTSSKVAHYCAGWQDVSREMCPYPVATSAAGGFVRTAFVTLILLATTVTPVGGEEVAAINLIRQPGSYTSRYVTVRGSMMNLRPATGPGPGVVPAGTAVVFDLVDGPAILTVLAPVPPSCRIGSAVSVDGRFNPTGQLGPQVYTNLLHATVVNCR